MEAIGTMAFDSNAPVRRDTIFRLASTTKPITAVGAMILVEECKVRLDDPVDEWPFAGTPDEFMKRLGSLPLAHQPGERWLYHMSGEILGGSLESTACDRHQLSSHALVPRRDQKLQL